jgi:hypothetical protein
MPTRQKPERFVTGGIRACAGIGIFHPTPPSGWFYGFTANSPQDDVDCEHDIFIPPGA